MIAGSISPNQISRCESPLLLRKSEKKYKKQYFCRSLAMQYNSFIQRYEMFCKKGMIRVQFEFGHQNKKAFPETENALGYFTYQRINLWRFQMAEPPVCR